MRTANQAPSSISSTTNLAFQDYMHNQDTYHNCNFDF